MFVFTFGFCFFPSFLFFIFWICKTCFKSQNNIKNIKEITLIVLPLLFCFLLNCTDTFLLVPGLSFLYFFFFSPQKNKQNDIGGKRKNEQKIRNEKKEKSLSPTTNKKISQQSGLDDMLHVVPPLKTLVLVSLSRVSSYNSLPCVCIFVLLAFEF